MGQQSGYARPYETVGEGNSQGTLYPAQTSPSKSLGMNPEPITPPTPPPAPNPLTYYQPTYKPPRQVPNLHPTRNPWADGILSLWRYGQGE